MVRISNFKLIEILRKNARMSFVEIAKALGVSEAAVRKRVRKLEADGIIAGYRTEINFSKLGLVHAIIGVDVAPEEYVSLLRKLKKTKCESIYASTGDHMLLIEVVEENMDRLSDFVSRLKKFKGVTKVCPAIILGKLK